MANFVRAASTRGACAMLCLLVLLSTMRTNALARDGVRPILVVTAVDNEFTALRSDLRNPKDGLLGGRQISIGNVDGAKVVVIRTGWGKAHAAGATAEAIARFSPRIVIMAGTAGSLDPQSVVSAMSSSQKRPFSTTWADSTSGSLPCGRPRTRSSNLIQTAFPRG